jgi:hypothetical protein
VPITHIDNPLTEANYREIQRGLNMAAQVLRKIQLAEQTGRDMTDYHTALNLAKDRLEKTKSVYFPDRP